MGRLYIEYIKHKINKKIIKISSPKNNFLNYKYIVPFTGIFICWLYFLKIKVSLCKLSTILEFLIFLLLPPNTLIGPITGGALFNSASKDYYIRKYIFPLLYLLSSSILKIRFKQCIFSTSLLKKYIPKDIKKISKFNFVFKAIKKNKKKYPNKKNIDFLFYYRDHTNKKTFFPFELLKKLIKQNYNIKIVGDKIYLKGITNLGYVSFGKVNSLLKKTKFTVISNENIFSFFTIDAINNNVKILIKDNQFNLLNNYKKILSNLTFIKTI